MKQRHSFSVVMLLAAGVFGGCTSSPQMSRIDRNRAVYETWPLETKQAVLDGKVEPGMNVDMVRVAWGEPTEVATSQAGDEIWVYQKGGDPGSVYYPGSMGSGSNIGMGGPMGVGTGTGIGISTGRGGTSIGGTTGIGMGVGGGMGGINTGIGGTGMGGLGTTPIVTPPTPPDIREVVFRNGVVLRADPPFNSK